VDVRLVLGETYMKKNSTMGGCEAGAGGNIHEKKFPFFWNKK
jgi:hypothetical protein